MYLELPYHRFIKQELVGEIVGMITTASKKGAQQNNVGNLLITIYRGHWWARTYFSYSFCFSI